MTRKLKSVTKVNMRSAVKNWIASADYDLRTAANLFKSRRYIYVVFLCHLAIEKILKALVCKRLNEMPPYTHNLNRLIELAGISLDEKHQEFIKDTLKNSFSVIPEVFIGNPVLLQSTSYRCPIETFGHDNFLKGSFSESPKQDKPPERADPIPGRFCKTLPAV
ncbi:MAG: hypothetical protein A2022_11810 [Deltaproteobacteria bacterium GWF2_42_12]|nr:MAG: hypothetical protein A2090_02915 [Deltaproteobacteria bacterium GWD2_42_10]OGP46335.1 MAG: hypothetical protein A2022_11810 [Deltaproteobacteria bacterium GWF2_42_12]OGQ75322.1 MAG: hypothetical protein A2235_07130 [Deltaproteobacteria bacterium RIFOXYA2_FULL_42_10]